MSSRSFNFPRIIPQWLALTLSLLSLSACNEQRSAQLHADVLIVNGTVYSGNSLTEQQLDLAICGETICFLGPDSSHIIADKVINARGRAVTPGFIDPHTHSLAELIDPETNQNLNYLTQGVTTVITGNDGEGTPEVAALRLQMEKQGIGTNVGLLVGHGAVRQQIMGLADRQASEAEMIAMESLVAGAMQAGALGFSTGLYYVPGRYANTEEVIALAKVAASYDGVYDSHIRDESTFNIGFLKAVEEAIEICTTAEIPCHLAHLKALGVDVWGQSKAAIEMIEQAQAYGLQITADQYPWAASGTFLHNAVIPSWAMAGSEQAYQQRLSDGSLRGRLLDEIAENIRRRGGPESLLITQTSVADWQKKTLQEVAQMQSISAAEAVLIIARKEPVRVASFNMSEADITAFMARPWVVTSSDGTDGHPRKYASFPKKYQQYVRQQKLLTFAEFVRQSASRTAEIFSLDKRGVLKVGFYADINVIDLDSFATNADFSKWDRLSTGIEHQFINGEATIAQSQYTGALPGVVVQNAQASVTR